MWIQHILDVSRIWAYTMLRSGNIFFFPSPRSLYCLAYDNIPINVWIQEHFGSRYMYIKYIYLK